MRNPIIALVWRQWRRTRWGILMVGVATLMSLSLLGSRLFVLTWITATQSIVINSWILLLLGVVLAVAGGEEKVLDQASKFMWNLPVRTAVWARVYLGYNVIVVGLFALVMTLVHFYVCGDTLAGNKDVAYVLWRLPLFAFGVTSILGSLFLLVSTLGNNRIGGIVSLVLFPLAVWVMGVFIVLSVKYRVPASLFVFGEIAVAYGMYYLAVTLNRRNAWSSVMARAPESIFSGRRRPFSSPLRALIWYEGKRFGGMFILGTAFVLSAVIIADQLSSIRLRWLSFYFLAIVATGMGGYLTVRRYYDHATGFNVFHFTKPVSTRTIAFSRVAALGLTLAGTLIGPFILFWLRYAITGDWPVVFSTSFYVVGLETIVALFLIDWMLTWFMLPAFYVSAFFWIIAYFWFYVLGHSDREFLPFGWFPFCIVFLSMVALFAVAARRRYFHWQSLLAAVSLWLLAMAAIIVLAVGRHPQIRHPQTTEDWVLFLMLTALTPMAALPFATIPLSIDWYRHR